MADSVNTKGQSGYERNTSHGELGGQPGSHPPTVLASAPAANHGDWLTAWQRSSYIQLQWWVRDFAKSLGELGL